ncbi:hypothetical protein BJ878DRAFT_482113 [Calycina marina]|uniref:Uncharacterized protein n=1 Tax=Calycina marina TaxID=1763456 RepID=A0A9P8CD80_9HELO|nr:hypothetical protein BJ878DRAFT_482113 [Calycina marina]
MSSTVADKSKSTDLAKSSGAHDFVAEVAKLGTVTTKFTKFITSRGLRDWDMHRLLATFLIQIRLAGRKNIMKFFQSIEHTEKWLYAFLDMRYSRSWRNNALATRDHKDKDAQSVVEERVIRIRDSFDNNLISVRTNDRFLESSSTGRKSSRSGHLDGGHHSIIKLPGDYFSGFQSLPPSEMNDGGISVRFPEPSSQNLLEYAVFTTIMNEDSIIQCMKKLYKQAQPSLEALVEERRATNKTFKRCCSIVAIQSHVRYRYGSVSYFDNVHRRQPISRDTRRDNVSDDTNDPRTIVEYGCIRVSDPVDVEDS